ncbi:LysR substrate-binding domain-containing protein [Comamonadaceae bacterium G21597-S1]|nr:LysR substrate-binding domain-containing protein [Comamonadaceae bacterium G21597-S1]
MTSPLVNKQGNPMRQTPLVRRLRLPQLLLVCMAGNGDNFRAMADALHVTQPAITKMAHELERTLGAAVFDRSASDARLTPFGQAVRTHAQQVLAALEQLEQDLPRYREGAAPALHLGSPSFTAAVLLARPVAQWLQQLPGVQVSMRDGVSADLLAALLAGELDCVIGSLEETAASDADLARLQFEPLYDDHVAFVTHADTAGSQRLRSFAHLLTLPWVMPPRNSQVWMALRREFTTAGHDLPRGMVEASSVPAIGAILSHAPGTIGAMRADVARYLTRHFSLRQLDIRPVIALPQVGILRLRAAPRSEPLETLLALVRAEVTELFARS